MVMGADTEVVAPLLIGPIVDVELTDDGYEASDGEIVELDEIPVAVIG